MSSPAMLRVLSQTVSTKRVPTLNGTTGKRGEPATNLTNVKCSQFFPVNEEWARTIALEAPTRSRECFMDGALDVITGDWITVSGKDYPVRYVESWEWRGSKYLHMVIEDLQR